MWHAPLQIILISTPLGPDEPGEPYPRGNAGTAPFSTEGAVAMRSLLRLLIFRPRSQEFVFQLLLEVPDEKPILVYLLYVLRQIADFEQIQRLNRHPVVLADGAKRLASQS